MDKKNFSNLNPIAFLQTFVSKSIEAGEKLGCVKCNSSNRLSHIEQLGLNASSCFEGAYRQESELDGTLDQDKAFSNDT